MHCINMWYMYLHVIIIYIQTTLHINVSTGFKTSHQEGGTHVSLPDNAPGTGIAGDLTLEVDVLCLVDGATLEARA